MKRILLISLLFFIVPLILTAKPKAVCRTCNDTGKAKMECSLCRGTKYVWDCHEKWGSRYNNEDSEKDWCGYGAKYTPLHKGCAFGRKRIWCPKCYKRTQSSGIMEVECPNCDGRGHLTRTYYILSGSEARSITSSSNREYYLRRLKKYGVEGVYGTKKKMTSEQLADYKIEHLGCKIFTSEDEIAEFIERGGDEKSAQEGSGRWYFVVLEPEKVTPAERARALKNIESDYPYFSGSNITRKKLMDDEVSELKEKYPGCKFFRDVEQFKSFLREL